MNVYYKWALTQDVPLFLHLIDPISGLGSTGKTPQVAIRRHKQPGGGDLDDYYYDGAGSFTVTPTYLNMVELDATNYPGIYTYQFAQSAIAVATVYLTYYRHLVAPIGDTYEEHTFSNEGEIGIRQIDFQIDDSLAAAIQGAQLYLYDQSNTSYLGVVKASDILGKTSMALNDGSYNLRLIAAGYSFTTPYTLTVSADVLEPSPLTIVGTGFSPPAPSAVDLCVVYGTIRDASGNAVAGACIKVYAETPQVVSGTQKGKKLVVTRTDTNGYFEMELVQGTEVTVTIAKAGIEVTRTVPSTASQDFTSWS